MRELVVQADSKFLASWQPGALDPVARAFFLGKFGLEDARTQWGLPIPPGRVCLNFAHMLDFGEGVPPAPVAARLGTGRRKLLHWERLYQLGGKPFALSRVHLHAGDAPIGRDEVAAHPTYSILEKLMGRRVGRADVSISYLAAPPDIAKVLRLRKGTPLLALERVSYDAKGIPLEHSFYFARAESYKFSLTVRGKLPITRSLKIAN